MSVSFVEDKLESFLVIQPEIYYVAFFPIASNEVVQNGVVVVKNSYKIIKRKLVLVSSLS